jgi:hypothetical protein
MKMAGIGIVHPQTGDERLWDSRVRTHCLRRERHTMDGWESTPPATDSMGGVRLVRTPSSSAARGIILSDELIGRATHYDGRRTTPCMKLHCDLCTKGLPWRWHGYTALWLVTQQERVILELTAQASQRLVDHHKAYGSLRGFDITVCRPKGKSNSRIQVVLGTKRHPEQLLPPCPDVPTIMSYIWGMPATPEQNVRNIIGRREISLAPQKPDGNGRLIPSGDGIGNVPPL